MHVNVQLRFNPALGKEAPYYRLKESYRDVRGNVHSLIILNIGFEPTLQPIQVRRIARYLTDRFAKRHEAQLPLGNAANGYLSVYEREMADLYWQRMKDEGGIDRFDKKETDSKKEAERYIDLDTVEHTDARNVGAEWLCKQAIDRLGIADFLKANGWTDHAVYTLLSHLIVRTVYAPSELASWSIMRDNSAACELVTGNHAWLPGLNALYHVVDKVYALKDKLETYLCNRVDGLFNLDNRILLFDLTNFYFEGSKSAGRKAQFGRSKEKRNDSKLLVLALTINKEGFIRYSSILEGNASDAKSLPAMAEQLARRNRIAHQKSLVVIDAGISTEENLRLLKEKGFNYLCVSRTRLKDYTVDTTGHQVTVRDARNRPITLRQIQTGTDEDFFLEVTSPSKAMTQASMNRLFRMRFEEELTKASDALTKKGGTKKYEKVIERVGRAIQKYPSVAKYYQIEYQRNTEKPLEMGKIDWHIKDLSGMERNTGVYFLRTNVRTFDEKTTWDYYNLIREIETTNRQLKTDLSLRPIYHQKDDRSDAHLFFGLLAYWVVNTIRHQLKQNGINCYWKEIVRRMSTQKLVTTEAINALGQKVAFRQCSKPTLQAKEIYDKLNFKEAPFRKRKICRTQAPSD